LQAINNGNSIAKFRKWFVMLFELQNSVQPVHVNDQVELI